MKDNKICVSKTVAYLVALVAVIVGAFYIMKVTNTQKLGTTPRATGISCNYYHSDFSSEFSKSSIYRYVARVEGNTCYGYKGYKNAAGNCVEEKIPCRIDKTGTTVKDVAFCNKSYIRVPNDSPTGGNLCGRTTGYKQEYYEANVIHNKYIKVNTPRCKTSEIVDDAYCWVYPTEVTEATSPQRIVRTAQCPVGSAWLSVVEDNTVKTTDYLTTPSRKDYLKNEYCVGLDGYAMITKNIDGSTKYRCMRTKLISKGSTGKRTNCYKTQKSEKFTFFGLDGIKTTCTSVIYTGVGEYKSAAKKNALKQCMDEGYSNCFDTKEECRALIVVNNRQNPE